MRNSKGVSSLMEQVFIMLFGVLILVTIAVTFSDLKDDTVAYSASPKYEAVAHQMNAVIASAAQQMNAADYGQIGFALPREIAGSSYIVRINSTHIRVEDFEQKLNRTALMVRANVTVSGNISSSDSGKTRAYFNSSARSITFTIV